MISTQARSPLLPDATVQRAATSLRSPRRLARWACVTGIIAALPTPSLIILASVGIPVGLLMALDPRRLLAVTPLPNVEGWTMTALVGSQLAIVGALLYGAAACTSRVVAWLVAHKAIVALFASFAAMLALGEGFDLMILRPLEAAPTEPTLENLRRLLAP